jgi:NAD(P)-dependent dehydrogenase (short-subunit alcohol dehydrogenase family)
VGYGPRSRQGRGGAYALGARFVALDVTDDANVAAAAERMAAQGGLDVLLNNGGIVGPRKAVPEITPHDLREVFKTNVFGIVRMTRAFLPLLERSANPVIVNVPQRHGLIAVTKDASRFESTLISLSGTGPENSDGGHD